MQRTRDIKGYKREIVGATEEDRKAKKEILEGREREILRERSFERERDIERPIFLRKRF